jgi:hypothetical protein
LSGLVAAFFPGVKFATRAGALRVDTAADLVADFTIERHAAAFAKFGAAHGDMVRGNRDGEPGGYLAFGMGIGFGPVKRYAESGAARATGSANLTHGNKKMGWKGSRCSIMVRILGARIAEALAGRQADKHIGTLRNAQ